MINLTSLLTGSQQPADSLRYGRGQGAPKTAAGRRPVVVWNITRRCNLRCMHCYSNSDARQFPGELSDEECRGVIEDLAQFGVPAILLSGGEPLIRPNLLDLAQYARDLGLRLTLSTNGTLVSAHAARRIKDLGFSYVGISLDGIGETHDRFRGRDGTFEKVLAAYHNCKAVDQKVGLRLTLTKTTFQDLDRILDFVEQEEIPRICFYHLVSSGRGASLEALRPSETRNAMDRIMDRVEQWAEQGISREVLTVDQPADAAYLLLKLMEKDPVRAKAAEELLLWNGGAANSSGTGIGNIDPTGNVHPDQFWQAVNLGNVRERPFSEIWSNEKTPHPVLQSLRERPRPVRGACVKCRWMPVCGGGFRARAFHKTGNIWGEDPACYLLPHEKSAAMSS